MRMTTPAVFLVLFTLRENRGGLRRCCCTRFFELYHFFGFYHERIGLKKNKKIRSQFKAVI